MSQQKITPTDLTSVPNSSRAGRDLPAAITVAVVLLAAVVFTLARFHWGFIALVAVALAMGVVEVSHALSRIGMHAKPVPLVIGTLATVLGSYYAGQHPTDNIPSNTLVLGLLAFTSLVCLVLRLFDGPEDFVRDTAASLFILGYIPLLGSTVSLMLAGEKGPQRIVAFLACVILSDTGGYVAGVLFGKHKMAPRISPKKSWEGFVGSVAFGIAGGVCASVWLLGVAWWVGIILGVLLVAFGTAGDLVESMVKRDAGIKDMSSVLPGHGGVMDRLDSLLVAAPVAWAIMYLMVPGG